MAIATFIAWRIPVGFIGGPRDFNLTTTSRYYSVNNPKEVPMVEITQEASEQVAKFFEGREVKPIRIFLNDGG